jgi:hypothetical protein
MVLLLIYGESPFAEYPMANQGKVLNIRLLGKHPAQ